MDLVEFEQTVTKQFDYHFNEYRKEAEAFVTYQANELIKFKNFNRFKDMRQTYFYDILGSYRSFLTQAFNNNLSEDERLNILAILNDNQDKALLRGFDFETGIINRFK